MKYTVNSLYNKVNVKAENSGTFDLDLIIK